MKPTTIYRILLSPGNALGYKMKSKNIKKNKKKKTYYIDCKMCVCVDGEAMMRCLKKFSLLLSIYMQVHTFQKNDQDRDSRDNFPGGGGGKARCGVIDLVSENIIIYNLGIYLKNTLSKSISSY